MVLRLMCFEIYCFQTILITFIANKIPHRIYSPLRIRGHIFVLQTYKT